MSFTDRSRKFREGRVDAATLEPGAGLPYGLGRGRHGGIAKVLGPTKGKRAGKGAQCEALTGWRASAGSRHREFPIYGWVKPVPPAVLEAAEKQADEGPDVDVRAAASKEEPDASLKLDEKAKEEGAANAVPSSSAMEKQANAAGGAPDAGKVDGEAQSKAAPEKGAGDADTASDAGDGDEPDPGQGGAPDKLEGDE